MEACCAEAVCSDVPVGGAEMNLDVLTRDRELCDCADESFGRDEGKDGDEARSQPDGRSGGCLMCGACAIVGGCVLQK